MPDHDKKVSVILLSGGQGRRFNHQDKGLILWNGVPLIEHVIQRLQPQCQQILINCNRNIPRYQAFGFPVFEDQDKGFAGPLEGIQSARSAVQHPWCLVAPNDTPLLPANLVSRLLHGAIEQNWQIAYPVCGARKHYLPVLIRTDILESVDKQLQQADRSLHQWYEHFTVGEVDFSDHQIAFANLNSPQALEAIS